MNVYIYNTDNNNNHGDISCIPDLPEISCKSRVFRTLDVHKSPLMRGGSVIASGDIRIFEECQLDQQA